MLLSIGCAQNNTSLVSAGELSGKLVILHTNDVHGHALRDPATGAIGYAAIAQLKKDLQSLGASVLLLDAGDASQGTSLVNLSQGKTAFESMNLAGYDAMAPGNHEFDWGSDNLLQNAQAAKFPILAANIVHRTGRNLVFDANKIFEMENGMKVGVFGLDTPETLTKTHPDKVKDIDFLKGEELYKCASDQVAELKAAGADYIVCLGHMGIDDESAPNRSTDIIEHVEGINLFIDGHSHTKLEEARIVGSTALVSTGEHFQSIGVVTIDSESLDARLYTGEDPEVAEYVSSVNAAVEEQLGEAFAKAEVDLDGERDPGVRTKETNLGDLAADAILWGAQQAVGSQVIASVTNGGGIRASIKAGDVTMNDMKTVFPFGNEISVLTVTGAELLEALEAATCSSPAAIGAFPQVAGIVFSVDTSVPYENGEAYPDSTYFKPAKPGSRVAIQTVGGEPFDLAKEYTIASNDFTAAGGDTYYAFRHSYVTSGYATGVSLEDALVAYVRDALKGVVGKGYQNAQGRITVK
jgi:2',3'-cyclic-nucleotide 2'-phosphodiesterase (5'-nucleotidase family)